MACGLCVPLCPTYRKTHNEADSPRGRVALMLAVAKGELALTESLERHLALCLACRACEKACPSYVPFGRLLDAARAMIASVRRPQTAARVRAFVLDRLIARPANLLRAGRLLRLYQRSGIQWLARKSGMTRFLGLAEADAELPPLPPLRSFAPFYAAERERRGAVAFFLGCLARVVDQGTLFAAIRLLNHLGYDVHVPDEQVCCGALHQHSGLPDTAAVLRQKNLGAFAGLEVEAVLTLASGCAATLCEYGDAMADSGTFGGRVRDMSDFLESMAWPNAVTFEPGPKRIAVHDPCTLSNVLRKQDKPYSLLRRLPGAEVFPLPENHLCCGAAGSYHLTEPQMARALRRDKIEHIRRLAPDIIVTSNIGCALYLAAGLREAGLNIEVVHPVVLLERQLQA